MENVAPFDSPKRGKEKSVQFDTHAMAFKLMLMDSGLDHCGDAPNMETISEHGKEARMDFYKNRSRSDGASTIMKSCLSEMKRMDEEKINDGSEMNRSSSFEVNPRKRLLSGPFVALDGDGEVEQERLEPLEIPKGAPLSYIPAGDSMENLSNFGQDFATGTNSRKKVFSEKRFVPYFTLPSTGFTLHCLLDDRRICLESVTSKNATLSGIVLVKNTPLISGDKGRNHRRIYVRRTLDDWKTQEDADAVFLESTKERSNVDRYVIQMSFPAEIRSGARLEFALAYEIYLGGERTTYWDNNNNANYAFWYSG